MVTRRSTTGMSATSRSIDRRLANDLGKRVGGIRRRRAHRGVEVNPLCRHVPERGLAIDKRRAELGDAPAEPIERDDMADDLCVGAVTSAHAAQDTTDARQN